VAAQQLGLDHGGGRHDDGIGGDGIGERQHAGHPAQRTVEAELADEGDPDCRLGGHLLVGQEHAEGDGEVERRPRLAQARRGQVHRDAAQRPGEPARQDRCAHAIARLAAGGVGRPDDGEAGQAARHVDLDGHRMAIDAEQAGRSYGREHGRSSGPGTGLGEGRAPADKRGRDARARERCSPGRSRGLRSARYRTIDAGERGSTVTPTERARPRPGRRCGLLERPGVLGHGTDVLGGQLVLPRRHRQPFTPLEMRAICFSMSG
jgi:hypothetical protein